MENAFCFAIPLFFIHVVIRMFSYGMGLKGISNFKEDLEEKVGMGGNICLVVSF